MESILPPHPMLAETDRDRYAIRRILDFYASQPTDYADYFDAAWRYQHRAKLRNSAKTLDVTATQAGGQSEVSANRLATSPGTIGRIGYRLRAPAYVNAGDANRKLSSLFLSLMDKMGMTLDRFGDADTRLAGL